MNSSNSEEVSLGTSSIPNTVILPEPSQDEQSSQNNVTVQESSIHNEIEEDELETKRREVARFLEEDDKVSSTSLPASPTSLPQANTTTSSQDLTKTSLATTRSNAGAAEIDSRKRTSEFFSRLLNDGAPIHILQKDAWKLIHMVFSPESGALNGYKDAAAAVSRAPKTRLYSITLRKFSITTPSLSHQRFMLKTPGNEYNLKPRTTEEKAMWFDWLTLMEKEQSLLDSQARTVGAMDIATNRKSLTSNSSVGSTAEIETGFRPSFWVPHEESQTCAFCNLGFNLRRWRHTCRTCGFVFCSTSKCFNDAKKTCVGCLTAQNNSVVAKTGPNTSISPVSPSSVLSPSTPGPRAQSQLQSQLQSQPQSQHQTQAELQPLPQSQRQPQEQKQARSQAQEHSTPSKPRTTHQLASTPPTKNAAFETKATPGSQARQVQVDSTHTKSDTSESRANVSASSTLQAIEMLKAERNQMKAALAAKSNHSSLSLRSTTLNTTSSTSNSVSVTTQDKDTRKTQLEALGKITSRVDKIMTALVIVGLITWLSLSVLESSW